MELLLATQNGGEFGILPPEDANGVEADDGRPEHGVARQRLLDALDDLCNLASLHLVALRVAHSLLRRVHEVVDPLQDLPHVQNAGDAVEESHQFAGDGLDPLDRLLQLRQPHAFLREQRAVQRHW